MKIFIVDDDRIIAETLKKHLEKWGFECECALDFQNITAQFASFDPQLVIIDIGLPFYNGYHWCSEIRKISKAPVVFLSSASDNMNIVMAINMGGDDFISKPFDLEVLTAKIQALLRRTYEFAGQSPLMERGEVILDTGNGSLCYRGGRIDLTKNEHRIMQTLMENAGRIVSRDTIMQRLWETDSFIDDNTLTVNVARLRKKLEEAGLNEFIETKKGAGYMVR